MTAVLDKGAHFLLGDVRDDRQERGECSWTLLADNTFQASPHRITMLERMPYAESFRRPSCNPWQSRPQRNSWKAAP